MVPAEVSGQSGKNNKFKLIISRALSFNKRTVLKEFYSKAFSSALHSYHDTNQNEIIEILAHVCLIRI